MLTCTTEPPKVPTFTTSTSNVISNFFFDLPWQPKYWKLPVLAIRDLSEISRRGGGVETEGGGSQLLEPQKREGS